MRLTEYLITEARKNPELNPKMSSLDQLKNIAQTHGTDDVFVRFTYVPKLGHNIQFRFDTPLGISAYPITHVINKDVNVEYAGENPHMVIFRVLPKANIWNLKEDDFLSVAPQILKSIKKVLSIKTVLGGKNIKDPEQITSERQLWYYMYEAIQDKIGSSVHSGKRPSVLARQILMDAGFDGVSDPGYGIIHQNEKTQAVFFNVRVLKQIGLIENKRTTNLPNLTQSTPETLLRWYLSLHPNNTILDAFSDATTINSTTQLNIIAKLGNYALRSLSGTSTIRHMLPRSDANVLFKYGLERELYHRVMMGDIE
jgi:hypothetical protein